MSTRRPTVAIIGAGFGGLWAARRLEGEGVDVVLLDRNNYHTFFPLLYQVAAAEIGPTEIAYPVRSILRESSNVRFRLDTVTGLGLGERKLSTASETPVSYDYLIVASGSAPHFFGVEGAEEHAFPLRWMDHALPLRHHILQCFEAASFEADPDKRRRLLTFVIVGGGPTGVEFTGALAELVFGPLRKDYPGIPKSDIRVVLVEALDGLLLAMDERLGQYAEERLRSRGAQIRFGAQASRVTADRIEFAEGDPIETETVVWTAGIRGDPEPDRWGLPRGKGGRVVVDETLRLADHRRTFVVGDLAYREQDGEPLPQVAPVAMQQGEYVAEAILGLLDGEEPGPFVYDDPGMLAVIGRNAAVAQFGTRTFTGFLAWVLWLAIHIAKLIGFRNRALVLTHWAWNYLSYEKAVRLILPTASDRQERDPMQAVEATAEATTDAASPSG